jgi:acetate kinase
MSDSLLTLNAGSSSIKYALFARDGATAQLRGQIDGIGVAGGALGTHDEALAEVLARVHAHGGARVAAVGHRIVHGGPRLVAPQRIDAALVDRIAALVPLAPLHQPHNVAGVRAALRAFPAVPQVACFDTAFHAAQPELNRRFALPQAWHDAGVRRYGFHGLSYESIVAQLAALDPAAAQGRVVVAHLGNGASMCAIRAGRSVATTMSFSPLDGLPMGTRCGRLDAAAVLHLIRAEGRSADEVEQLLFRKSGLLGLSGVSSDMRALEASTAPAAAMAIDYFVEHAVREVAGMAAALRGLDTLVFTGGIGENARDVRERIVREAAWLPPFDVRVLHTDEEAVIARHTAALLAQ